MLVSVNGTELTYDANGNLLTYGDKEYTWNTGRNLAQITDGDNTYSYTYDEKCEINMCVENSAIVLTY